MFNSNVNQTTLFSEEGPMYQQIKNKIDMMNPKAADNLPSPFLQHSSPYNSYSYPYNPSECNIQDRIRYPYTPFVGNSTSFKDKTDFPQSSPYYPNHLQTDKIGRRNDNDEGLKDKQYCLTKQRVIKEEHESKPEQFQYMQPYAHGSLLKEHSEKREEILCQRTSVITRTNQADLEYKARMLKYEGSILRHTGNIN